VRRPLRGDRPQRGRERERDRHRDDRERPLPPAQPRGAKAPVDEFFTKPYEPAAGTEAEGKEPEAEATTRSGKKAGKVAALLGGRQH
jgi:hypothetical protein